MDPFNPPTGLCIYMRCSPALSGIKLPMSVYVINVLANDPMNRTEPVEQTCRSTQGILAVGIAKTGLHGWALLQILPVPQVFKAHIPN